MPIDPQKALVARQLVAAKYPNFVTPDDNIRATLDEPVEQFATAHFYNGPAAHWVADKTPFRWVVLDPHELDAVQTIRDFGKLCYIHLADKMLTKASHEVFE
jgi:hypothetical protein